jgi:hypothetical protein
MITDLPVPRRESTPDQIIFGLVRNFPCLTTKVRRWLDRATEFDPDEFHALFARASSSELHCALFILNVWSHSYAVMKGWRFDLHAFINCADDANRQVLLDWMAKPYLL